jgi:hypothetical protein
MARDIRALHFERIEGTRAQERASSRQESTFREGGRGYESSEHEDKEGVKVKVLEYMEAGFL